MKQFSVDINEVEDEFNKLSSEGKTVVFCTQNTELIGILAIEDPIKSTSVEAISKMEKLGLTIFMLTGDNNKSIHCRNSYF